MTPRMFLLRLADGFFRRWLLYLIPVVAFGVLGFFSATARDEYRAEGTLFVQDETLLAQLTEVRPDGPSLKTPADAASERLWGLLQTDTFMDDILDLSDTRELFMDENENSEETYRFARQSVLAWAGGSNFLTVAADSEDPAIATRLADATIEAVTQWQIESDVAASREAEAFFSDLVVEYRSDLDAARDALNAYLIANPEPAEVLRRRPLTETVEIERLQREVDLTEETLLNAVTKTEDARLATAQTESDVRRGLLVVDPPVLPQEPIAGLRDLAIRIAVFAFVGGLASAAVLVVTTMADSSIRFPSEIPERLGIDVVAVVAPTATTGSRAR